MSRPSWIPVVESEDLVGQQRMQHDPSALAGVPAHITLLYPFIPPVQLGQPDMSRLRRQIGEIEPFVTVLATANRFPGVVWLAPETTEPLFSLMHIVWTEYPPHGGTIESKKIVPHLAVAHLGGAEALGLVATLEGALPITSRVDEVRIMTSQQGR